MHLQGSTEFYLDLQVKVKLNVAQCPLHHVTYAPTEFEVTTSKALGGEALTRKFNIWPLTLTLGSRSHKMLPNTLYIMWPIQLQSLKLQGSNRLGGDTFTKKIHHLIFDLDLGVKVTQNVAQYPLHYVTFSATMFEVATSKGLGGDAFTRKFNIWPLTLGSRSHKMLPSTLYIMWPFQLQSLKLVRLTV